MASGGVGRALFPEPARRPARWRAWNIAFRTLHLAVTGVLLGGHAFAVPADRLRPLLWGAIASGSGLIVLESYKSLHWLHEAWGAMVLAKLTLLCLVPFFWDLRLPLLISVVVLASVESHMPARYRHYSLLFRRVMQA